MVARPLTPEQVLLRLADTPPRLAALTATLPSARLSARPSPAEWSLNEILAHLRACADMWGGYMRTILAEDQPTWRAVNPTTWIKQTNYPELEFRRSLRAFTAQRAALLALLPPLPTAAWSRSATVTGGGRPRPYTVLAYAQRLVKHEQSHLRSIARRVALLRP